MTGRIIPLQGDRHSEIQRLLPWYGAGTLDEADRLTVQTHLAGCADCQAELKAERRLVVELAEAGPPEPGVEEGWAAMRRTLARERTSRAPAPGFAARLAAGWRALADQWFSGPPLMRWAVAGQACLLLALGAGVVVTLQPARYHALSAPAPAAAKPGNIVVIFRPETTEAQLRDILRTSRARLVDGPTAADAYLLQAPAADRPAVLKSLHAHPQVVMAEAIDNGAPS